MNLRHSFHSSRALLLSAGVCLALALAVCLKAAETAAPVTQHKPLPRGYAGAETCARCHDPESFTMDATRHATATKDGVTGCEVCHGPGAGHAAAHGDRSKIYIFDPAKNNGRQQCAACHQDPHPDSPPGHREQDCLRCHGVHHSKDVPLLRMPRAKLCQSCH